MGSQPDGRARSERAAGRLLRQSRHRHSDAGVELHPDRHERAAPKRERHARLRPVPLRRRRRPGPDQCRQADRHRAADHELLLLGRLVRDDPRRSHRPCAARRDAGRRERRSRQLDDPRQDGEGHGRRHGPRRRGEEGRRDHGAQRQGKGRLGRAEAPAQVLAAAHRRERRRHGDHRSRRLRHRQEERRHDLEGARPRRDARRDQVEDGGEPSRCRIRFNP